jgi:hypothetical protein
MSNPGGAKRIGYDGGNRPGARVSRAVLSARYGDDRFALQRELRLAGRSECRSGRRRRPRHQVSFRIVVAGSGAGEASLFDLMPALMAFELAPDWLRHS